MLRHIINIQKVHINIHGFLHIIHIKKLSLGRERIDLSTFFQLSRKGLVNILVLIMLQDCKHNINMRCKINCMCCFSI